MKPMLREHNGAGPGLRGSATVSGGPCRSLMRMFCRGIKAFDVRAALLTVVQLHFV